MVSVWIREPRRPEGRASLRMPLARVGGVACWWGAGTDGFCVLSMHVPGICPRGAASFGLGVVLHCRPPNLPNKQYQCTKSIDTMSIPLYLLGFGRPGSVKVVQQTSYG